MISRFLRQAISLRIANKLARWSIVLLLVSCQGSTDQGAGRLLTSSSPYLRDHADNPVNWYEWSDEAFELAHKQNKPVIVSIGYAACHWCHVMERESFMDPEVARVMNENFISIKVDREERPDIDQQFVYASTALTGTAGWPLNAFALPDGKPFHTITYHTKTEWIDLLKRISAAWKDDSNKIVQQANSLTQGIKPMFEYKADTTLSLDLPAFINHIPSIYSSLDFNNGGIKGYPKFPMPSLIEFMLQHYHLTGDKRAEQWITTTLDAIANGGLYDHIGGGFARYSTDSLWHVPHFEKMLYDNAQLISIFAKAYKVTRNKRYKKVVHETIRFVERELKSDRNLYLSSLDADSDNEEGKFYKWTPEQLQSAIGAKSMSYFDVSKENILRAKTSADIDSLKAILYDARAGRIYPLIDGKIITSWNAMMLTGYIDAVTALNDDDHLRMASSLLDNLNPLMFKDERVFRSMLDNKIATDGYLEDYAWLAKANIHMYEASLNAKYLETAKAITDIALKKFENANSPFFYYSASPDNRLIRNTEIFDQAIPSSNSVFAEVLLKLGEYYQDELYTKGAHDAIAEAVASLDIDITTISNWARLAEIIHYKPYEIAIMGEDAIARCYDLQRNYLPTAIFMGGNEENLPLLENKLIPGQTTIYVCRDRTCKLPVKDAKEALKQIVYK
jgi:uncharacterized protein YyaL (SSP411 family)